MMRRKRKRNGKKEKKVTEREGDLILRGANVASGK